MDSLGGRIQEGGKLPPLNYIYIMQVCAQVSNLLPELL